jgi:hypothetical protein
VDKRFSSRVNDVAKRHRVSRGFIYAEIRAKRLRAKKAANGVTIITDEDEAAWLDAMPDLHSPAHEDAA